MSIDTGQQTIHIGESGNRGGHGSIGLSGRRVIKGDVLNCCGKMPSLRKAGLTGSCSLPEQLGRIIGVRGFFAEKSSDTNNAHEGVMALKV